MPQCHVIRKVPPVLCCQFAKHTLSRYTATQIAFSTKPRECILCEATSINYTDPYLFLFIYLLMVYLTNLSVCQDYRAGDGEWEDEYILKNELETMSRNLPYSRERPHRYNQTHL